METPTHQLPDKGKSRQMATVFKTASRRAAAGEKRNMLRNWSAGGGIRSSDRARLRENYLLQAGLDGCPGAWGWWCCKLSGKRTKVNIAGKKAKTKMLKAGLMCDVTYPGHHGMAKAITCK